MKQIVGKYTFMFMLLLGLVLVTACGSSDANIQSPEKSESQRKLHAKGNLVPRRFINLSFEQSGKITEVYAHEGQVIKEGQPIAQIGYIEAFQADVADADYQLLLAQQDLKELYANAKLTLAQSTLDLSEAQQEKVQAQTDLENLEVPEIRVQQAKANMLLAQDHLRELEKRLDKIERLINKPPKVNEPWYGPKQFRPVIAHYQVLIAGAEKNYWEAMDKYNKLAAPIDEVDLALAEADLFMQMHRSAC